MDWLDAGLNQLIEGLTLNIVGLSGSGRSESLRTLAAALGEDDWVAESWPLSDLRTMTRAQMTASVNRLRDPARIPVLLIDDFGEFLMEGDGQWFERMLFNRTTHPDPDGLPTLRCVVVTHPRDREVVGPGSGLRERVRETYPMPRVGGSTVLANFRCETEDELVGLCGGNGYLLMSGGSSAPERRGNQRAAALRRLPHWVGQLDAAHQHRLAIVLDRDVPPRWRDDEADSVLAPLAVRVAIDGVIRCSLPACISADDLRPLLVGQPWPSKDPKSSASRFVARCGNDPNPLWVDNFLSDVKQLDFELLVAFLHRALDLLPSVTRLRLLSRSSVDGRTVDGQQIQEALSNAGLRMEVGARIEWRLYDQKTVTNLHRRELLLSRRGAGFTLPSAQITIGQKPAGNETDSVVAFASSATTKDAWKSGRVVWPRPISA